MSFMGFEEKITELLRLREQGLLTPDIGSVTCVFMVDINRFPGDF